MMGGQHQQRLAATTAVIKEVGETTAEGTMEEVTTVVVAMVGEATAEVMEVAAEATDQNPKETR